MKKIILGIIKTGNEYRAMIQTEENLFPVNKEVIYQSNREIENSLKDIRTISRELKEEAKKWAHENKIPYIINIDFDPYE